MSSDDDNDMAVFDREIEDEYTLILKKPIKDGDTVITEFTLREPTAKEMKQANALPDPMDSNLKLISAVSGIPKPALEQMVSRDFQKCSRFFARFSPPDPKKTGS